MKQATLLLCAAATMVLPGCSGATPSRALDALAEGDHEGAREIYSAGVDPNEEVKGQTPLTMVACRAPGETIDLLIEVGADPDRPNRRRLTPLIVASRCGNLPAVRRLLAGGADPNLGSPGGTTPLTVAREASEDEVVEVLVEAGAAESQAKTGGRRKATGY